MVSDLFWVRNYLLFHMNITLRSQDFIVSGSYIKTQESMMFQLVTPLDLLQLLQLSLTHTEYKTNMDLPSFKSMVVLSAIIHLFMHMKWQETSMVTKRSECSLLQLVRNHSNKSIQYHSILPPHWKWKENFWWTRMPSLLIIGLKPIYQVPIRITSELRWLHR